MAAPCKPNPEGSWWRHGMLAARGLLLACSGAVSFSASLLVGLNCSCHGVDTYTVGAFGLRLVDTVFDSCRMGKWVVVPLAHALRSMDLDMECVLALIGACNKVVERCCTMYVWTCRRQLVAGCRNFAIPGQKLTAAGRYLNMECTSASSSQYPLPREIQDPVKHDLSCCCSAAGPFPQMTQTVRVWQ